MRCPVATGRRLQSGDGPGKRLPHGPRTSPEAADAARPEELSGWGRGPRGADGRPGSARRRPRRGRRRAAGRPRRAADRGPWRPARGATPSDVGEAPCTGATRGGRALALGEPAERDPLAEDLHLGDRDRPSAAGSFAVPGAAHRQQQRLAGQHVDREDEAAAAGAELELLLRRRRRRVPRPIAWPRTRSGASVWASSAIRPWARLALRARGQPGLGLDPRRHLTEGSAGGRPVLTPADPPPGVVYCRG